MPPDISASIVANMVQELCNMKYVRVELEKEDHEHTFGKRVSANK